MIRIPRIVAALAAPAALAGALFLARPTGAFVLSGDSLALDQRDVRVFDNFSDPLVHVHQVPEEHYPGVSGPALAIWKACAEWGSELHGDGSGDFHQLFDIGSGGANFDALFQGLAPGVGGIDDNVHSQINGSNSMVIAFTELATSDGWRIRYWRDPWDWRATPAGTSLPGTLVKDLQGIATHEYGHALGLGHSSEATATMVGTAAGFGVELRSIEADDIAGLQAIYGARSASKPRLATWRLVAGGPTGSWIEIEGSGFHATDNEVWLPDGGASADGTPLKIAAPSTANGTRITIARPVSAGRGDLAVKRDGQTHDALSNALPFDPDSPPCPAPIAYGSGKTTSLGNTPTLTWTGSTKQSIDTLVLECEGVPNAIGVLFYGLQAHGRPFFGGTLYARPPLQRHLGFTFDFGGQAFVPLPITADMIGQTRYYQMWFVDAGDPFGVGLSSGLALTFCP